MFLKVLRWALQLLVHLLETMAFFPLSFPKAIELALIALLKARPSSAIHFISNTRLIKKTHKVCPKRIWDLPASCTKTLHRLLWLIHVLSIAFPDEILHITSCVYLDSSHCHFCRTLLCQTRQAGRDVGRHNFHVKSKQTKYLGRSKLTVKRSE